MIQLNFGGHVSGQPDFMPFPESTRKAITAARDRTRWIARNVRTADPYFKTLPAGRTLTDLIGDSSIWISYFVSTLALGVIIGPANKEIAIGDMAFAAGQQMVLATLIHELAHAGGAPILTGHAAERAVLACGLGKQSELKRGVDDPKTPYDPTIMGSARPRTGRAFA